MASTNRLLSFLFLGAIAAAVSACASPAVQECGATGVFCPAGTHCAAAQGICISDTNTCGNAHMDSGEICDDGNTKDGDGCSADCSSTEACGNGIVDQPIKDATGHVVAKDPKNEDCDPPLTMDPQTGMLCSALCKFEVCGNGIKDEEAKEVCDDGNTTPGDGCSANCKSDERCGNGILDQPIKDSNGNPDLNDQRNEICDPPRAGTCSTDCRSLLNCGNSKLDPGEECDDGPLNGDDRDCRRDCVINRCGDGRPNLLGAHHEDCDGGPLTADFDRTAIPTEKANCNIDCSTPRCGDGKVNRSFTPAGAAGPEQCDDSIANADNADCTATCQVNFCGDSFLNTVGPLHREGCDDGNRDDTDNCTNACITRACGDGVVGPGEECDLGMNNSDTGACLSNCFLAKCGDGKVRMGVEQCDGTPGCSAACQRQECGNGVIDPGEECDSGMANNDNGDCRSDCLLNRCGDGHVNTMGLHQEVCDAGPVAAAGDHTVTPTETANCNINCTTPSCGDGVLNRHFVPLTVSIPPLPAPNPEQCDDGLRVNGDGCSADCQFERCGNGIVDPGEECDGLVGLQPCSSTCFQQKCGNGIVDPSEECDNGNANNDNADCRTDCVINRCGDGHINTSVGLHHEQCDGGPVAGPGDRTATPRDTLDCNSSCTSPSCGDNIVNRSFIVPGTTFAEQCDPPGNGCSPTCRLEVCGNGVKDPNEQCDDGNRNDGDACENDCTSPRCGNTILDAGEQCDEGPNNGTSSTIGECDLFCHLNGCGNGFLDLGEECDPGMAGVDTATCNRNCTIARCGDGLTNAAMNPREICDDGPTNGDACGYDDPLCTRCNSTCTGTVSPGGPFCGDGLKQTAFSEQCDPAGGFPATDSATCDSDCTPSVCGDGHQNTALEGCDDHNNNACGLCNLSCVARVTATAATGQILAASSNLITQGDTFTLDDGFHTPVVFEFRNGGQSGGIPFKIVVDATATSADDVGAAIADAVETNHTAGKLDITTTSGTTTATVILTNLHKSSIGNRAIGRTGDIVTSFTFANMANGVGGDCGVTIGCTANGDCGSNLCDNGQCKACAVNADCGASRTCSLSTNVTVGGVCSP